MKNKGLKIFLITGLVLLILFVFTTFAVIASTTLSQVIVLPKIKMDKLKHMFGKPSRITSQIHLGKRGFNIERKAKLGGCIYNKAGLILAGFLAGRYSKYSKDKPLSV